MGKFEIKLFNNIGQIKWNIRKIIIKFLLLILSVKAPTKGWQNTPTNNPTKNKYPISLSEKNSLIIYAGNKALKVESITPLTNIEIKIIYLDLNIGPGGV